MKKKYCFLLLTLLFAALGAFAQTGKVTLVKDPLIDSLISRRIALSKGINNDGSLVEVIGYRVQVFFGNDRQEAYNQQTRFKSIYPEFGTYISYTQPNYRVKVGDFRSRADAQKLMNELRSDFPTLFIFTEKINPIKADEYDANK